MSTILYNFASRPRVWVEYETGVTPIGMCYVAGPMTGRPGFNYQAFDGAAKTLAAEGWRVINPANLDRKNLGIDFASMTGHEDLSQYRTEFARQDIESLLLVSAVFLLPEWQHSTGASNEAAIASMLGVPLFDYATREPVAPTAQFSNTAKAQ